MFRRSQYSNSYDLSANHPEKYNAVFQKYLSYPRLAFVQDHAVLNVSARFVRWDGGRDLLDPIHLEKFAEGFVSQLRESQERLYAESLAAGRKPLFDPTVSDPTVLALNGRRWFAYQLSDGDEYLVTPINHVYFLQIIFQYIGFSDTPDWMREDAEHVAEVIKLSISLEHSLQGRYPNKKCRVDGMPKQL